MFASPPTSEHSIALSTVSKLFSYLYQINCLVYKTDIQVAGSEAVRFASDAINDAFNKGVPGKVVSVLSEARRSVTKTLQLYEYNIL